MSLVTGLVTLRVNKAHSDFKLAYNEIKKL